MSTRDIFINSLKAQGLHEWFILKYSKADGTWERQHGYDTGWRFADDPPSIWFQQDALVDPHEYGTTDKVFGESADPEDMKMIEFMKSIGFAEVVTEVKNTCMPERWPKFVREE